MAISSVLLSSALGATDRSQINDLTGQLVNWMNVNLLASGIPYNYVYDNLAIISPTVGRCVVLKIGDCPHSFQINAASNTQVTVLITGMVPGAYPTAVSAGSFNRSYTLQNLTCRMMFSLKTFLLKFAADGVTSETWMAMPFTDGLYYAAYNTASITTRTDDTVMTCSNPTYPNVVDGLGNNSMIPGMVNVGGIMQTFQPNNIFGVTLTSLYYFFTDLLGVHYYYGSGTIVKELS